MNPHIPRCQYVKTDGRRCGSPSLRTKRYCYFHYEVNRAVAHLDIPPLEDGNAIQLALTDLARAIVEDRIAPKPAALLAYILQTAAANLKHVHLGVFPDRMITELPSLDPYSRGLYPEPGERNRDPEQPAAAASAPLQSSVILSENASASEGPGRPPAQAREGRIHSAPSAFQALDPSEGHDFNRARKAVPMTSSALPKASAPEGRPRIAQGVSPGTAEDERIPTTLPEAGAQVVATAAPKKPASAMKPISASRDFSSR